MKPIKCSLLIASTAAMLLASACGERAELVSKGPQAQSLGLQGPETGAGVSVCDLSRLAVEGARFRLSRTPAYKALILVAEWAPYDSAVQAANNASCGYRDPSPSQSCQQLNGQIQTALDTLKTTTAYQTLAAARQWQDLQDAYADADSHSCWTEWQNQPLPNGL